MRGLEETLLKILSHLGRKFLVLDRILLNPPIDEKAKRKKRHWRSIELPEHKPALNCPTKEI